MQALALVRATEPAELVFVGPIADSQREQLQRAAAALKLGGAVHFTGGVSELEYQTWLRRACCAVQVRAAASGATSASLYDCLSVGLPVITNTIPAEELPPDAIAPLAGTPSVEDVAARVIELLSSEELRRRHRSAALAYARQATFDQLADALVAIVQTMSGTARPAHAAAG
jgi:glycosyltransferase involved in cell wall biosynthesis